MTSDIGKTRITKFNITNSPTVIITDINDIKPTLTAAGIAQ
jgi:hypothetical protein